MKTWLAPCVVLSLDVEPLLLQNHHGMRGARSHAFHSPFAPVTVSTICVCAAKQPMSARKAPGSPKRNPIAPALSAQQQAMQDRERQWEAQEAANRGGGASGGAASSGGVARGPQAADPAARRASARAWMAGADVPEPDLDAVVDR